MSTTYVAVDVETTGLDARADAIIEVAAVTFNEDGIVHEWSSLVNPFREVPPFITRLTGITQKMVDDAPAMFSVRPEAKRLLGSHVLVGHNVEFDLGFLRGERLAVGNHRLDTLTLATILLPSAGRFGLQEVCQRIGLPPIAKPGIHRARSDALQTARLFLALRQRVQSLEFHLLEEIVRAGRSITWPETLFFEEVLRQRARQAFEPGGQVSARGELRRLFQPGRVSGRALAPADEPEPIDAAAVAGMLRPGGNFSRAFPAYEYRPQQVQMVEAVAQAFNQSQHLIIEAGTGTGKSIGYLLPAAFWAQENGRRVVVSTNTINLQDQLIHKDLPELQKLLPFELRAAVLKGKRNYLCTRLFQQMRHNGPSNADEMALFARLLLWLPQTPSGDVAEISLRSTGESLAWARLSADNDTCKMDTCGQEQCPLHIARRRAELAHILVVNHALLLADVASENRVLPEYGDLVIDEAHHLEAAVTDGLSFRADRKFLEALLEEVIRPRAGVVGDLQSRARAELPVQLSQVVDGYAEQVRQAGQRAAERLDEFFDALAVFLQSRVSKRSQFAEQVRLTPEVRAAPGFDEVELSWDNVNKVLASVVEGVVRLAAGLGDVLDGYGLADGDDLRLALINLAQTLDQNSAALDALVMKPAEEMIYWLEASKERVSLHAAPLRVGPLVEKHVFATKDTVILTSATLRTAGLQGNGQATFEYLRGRLHAHMAGEIAVGSPFDYKNSTLVYLCSDMPEPNQPGYQRYVEEAIVAVAKALGGRTMALFTANAHLAATGKAIERPLAEADITLLMQAEGASRQQLLSHFKASNGRTVLLGTRSFWEGVDVPGAALTALVIAKLPFDVPSDPIFAARAETFENSFVEYSIPEAVLRFRQGFGRLIRRQDDEGIVVVLDKRVMTKQYGRYFLEALPECTVIRQPVGRLGELALRWLNRAKQSPVSSKQ